MFDEEDEDAFVSNKFEDCRECRNRFSEIVCNGCDVGEEFEEEDYDELDKHFRGRL